MDDTPKSWAKKGAGGKAGANGYAEGLMPLPSGRWPANCILGGDFDDKFPKAKLGGAQRGSIIKSRGGGYGSEALGKVDKSLDFVDGGGSTSRYFYNITEENKLRDLVAYLHKLITPPGGTTLFIPDDLPQY